MRQPKPQPLRLRQADAATPKGNGFQATITYANGVGISSAESYPTKADAISAAAMKLLDMPERLEAFDAADADI